MNDPVQFLRGMADYYGTEVAHSQETFVRRVQLSIDAGRPLLIEADGGIGKTIGYLVCGLHQAYLKQRPLIITTSTTTNRDQIMIEFEKIMTYAKTSGDPIATIPFFNYRSIYDYASPYRTATLIERLQSRIPASVMRDLRLIYDRLLTDGSDGLLDTVMPYDLTDETDKVFVHRHEIAVHERDTKPRPGELSIQPPSFYETRKDIDQHRDRACVIVMTQAMFAKSPKFHKAIRSNQIAGVVIDEVDKLTSIDFITFTNLLMPDLHRVLRDIAIADLDVADTMTVLHRLDETITAIKGLVPHQKNVVLIPSKIGHEHTRALQRDIVELATKMVDLNHQLEELPVDDWDDEIERRGLLFEVEEITDSCIRLAQSMYPSGFDRWIIDHTDVEVFLSWDTVDEFRVVAGRPGAVIGWLFKDTIEVPVLLTTAFLGESDRSFAWKINMPMYRLNREPAIRAMNYGTLDFVYFSGLQPAIWRNPRTTEPEVNPAHFDDLDRILHASPWGWVPGRRIVVLAPGYHDIKEILTRLDQHEPRLPVFAHQSGTNLNDIRDRLVHSNAGGILLTVYWEGFNIVATDRTTGRTNENRRGLIDVLVMSRIPFHPPNPTLEALQEHFTRRNLVFPDMRTETKRRIHQGFNRVIRGAMDKGTVLICDSRFPAPKVLTDRTDALPPSLRRHVGLLQAIPERFLTNPSSFDVRDVATWTSVL